MIKLLHRGDTLNYPENTIESIKSALNNINYNGFETDLQLTKDDKPKSGGNEMLKSFAKMFEKK